MKNETSNNTRIIFDIPDERVTSDIINEILDNYHLKEDYQEIFEKMKNLQEPRLIILKDAATALFQKKINDEGLAKLLAKHLSVNLETAQNMVNDIKQQLLPYAKIVTEEPEEVTPQESAPSATATEKPKVRRVVPAATKPASGEEDKYRETIE